MRWYPHCIKKQDIKQVLTQKGEASQLLLRNNRLEGCIVNQRSAYSSSLPGASKDSNTPGIVEAARSAR